MGGFNFDHDAKGSISDPNDLKEFTVDFIRMTTRREAKRDDCDSRFDSVVPPSPRDHFSRSRIITGSSNHSNLCIKVSLLLAVFPTRECGTILAPTLFAFS